MEPDQISDIIGRDAGDILLSGIYVEDLPDGSVSVKVDGAQIAKSIRRAVEREGGTHRETVSVDGETHINFVPS